MSWYFKDSEGVKGPLTEAQIRESVNSKGIDSTATVRHGESSWVSAESIRAKFEKLDQEGTYLRSDDKIHGPFGDRRADELRSKNPDRFDSYKIGKNGKWVAIEKPKMAESVRQEVSQPPPLNVTTPVSHPPISFKEGFTQIVSLAKQTAKRIANDSRVQGAVEKTKELAPAGLEKGKNLMASVSSDPLAIGQTEDKKSSPNRMVMLGCGGCGGCVVVPVLFFVVIVVIGSFLPKIVPSVTISGTTGTITVTLSLASTIKGGALKILKGVHDVAQRNKELEKVIVNVKMSSFGVTDNYGNKLKDDIEMGTITISNLDEVRKYSDSRRYGFHSNDSEIVQTQLLRMNGASLLE